MGAPPNFAGGVGRVDDSAIGSGERPDEVVSPHESVEQGDRFYARAAARRAEQTEVANGRVVHVQVADGVSVALELGVVTGAGEVAAHAVESCVGVVVGVVGIAAYDVRFAYRVCRAVAVGVEIEVGVQLVAEAVVVVDVGGGRRAAHVGVAAQEGVGVVCRVPGGHAAVPVQIPPDGVQMGEGGHFNQPVVVLVVVAEIHAVVGLRA